jgi:hypothetical protein
VGETVEEGACCSCFSLWCRWSIIGVRKWCSFHIRPPRGCRAHALPGPIETSCCCCCWFFCWSISALCLLPPALSLCASTHPPPFPVHALLFWHMSSRREGLFVCSEHCLHLGTALGWRRNVFQIGFFFFFFSFGLYWMARVDWVLYKTDSCSLSKKAESLFCSL